LRQDVRNVATQVRTHRTHGTQNIRRLRQDATPADQTQDPFLLIKEASDNIRQHKFREFIGTMPDRCQAVIDANGLFTKY